MRLCRCDQGRESDGVLDGHVRQDLAVELDAAELQAVHKLAVRNAVVACGGADALNPQSAEIAFARAAIAERISQRTIDRFLGGAVELALCEEEALGVPE